MGLFDSLEGMAMQELRSQGPGLLNQALANTPLASASGMIDQLIQGGLGPQVAALQQGDVSAAPTPEQIGGALDPDHVQQMAQSLGINPEQILSLISQHLPAMAQQQAG